MHGEWPERQVLILSKLHRTQIHPSAGLWTLASSCMKKTKKEREARKAQTKVEIKEIRLRPKTNVHHRSFKVRDARRWLDNGMKVKVRIRFRGREIDYLDLALKDLKEVAEELSDVAQVEQAPGLEGRSMLMVLAPSKAKKK
jgi:translation initiation factor IF-3